MISASALRLGTIFYSLAGLDRKIWQQTRYDICQWL